MPSPSRRDFLKSAAAAAFTLALNRAASRASAADAPIAAGSIRSIVTDSSGKRLAPGPTFAWGDAPAGHTITINPAKTAQTISGFGSSLTDSSCYMIDQLAAPARQALLEELFSPDQMGLTVCRLCIGASDYATKLYSYDEGDEPDPDLKRFSIDHDRAHVIPVLVDSLKVNPKLFLFGSPWSPPGWMKYGGSMLGGSMKPQNLGAYAHYILKFLQEYQAAGVHLSAITIQNEVDADQSARMPSCIWAQEVEDRYITDNLGPLLRDNSIDTKIWILDHNYDLIGRVLDQLSKPEVKQYVGAVAWHGYAGVPEQMMRIWDVYPGFDMHWTEGGSDYNSADYLTDWARWSAMYARILHNGPSSITTWNLALDEMGRPVIGPFSCGGLVTIHSQTKEIIRCGLYWTLSHHSRAFRPGSKIIATSGDIPAAISHIAAQRPDGSFAMILTNTSAVAQSVRIASGNRSAAIAMPGDSVMTLEWSA